MFSFCSFSPRPTLLLRSQSRQQHNEPSHPSIPKEFQLDLDMIEEDMIREEYKLPDLIQHNLDELLEPIIIPKLM